MDRSAGIKIYGIKYGGRFLPTLEVMLMGWSFLMVMTQLHISITIYEIEGSVGLKEQYTTEEFAAEINRVMLDNFKLKSSNASVKEKFNFIKHYI